MKRVRQNKILELIVLLREVPALANAMQEFYRMVW